MSTVVDAARAKVAAEVDAFHEANPDATPEEFVEWAVAASVMSEVRSEVVDALAIEVWESPDGDRIQEALVGVLRKAAVRATWSEAGTYATGAEIRAGALAAVLSSVESAASSLVIVGGDA